MLQQPDSSVSSDVYSPTALPPSSHTSPSKPPPGRRKPERKPSTSSYPAEIAISSSSTPQAIPIPPSPPTLFSALRSLFYHMASQPTDKGSVAPKTFIEKLKELNEVFRSTMHQDAHEFLNYLLNQIVEEMDEERKQAQQNGAAQGDELAASVATLSSKVPTVQTAASSSSGTRPRDATLVHKLFEGILTSETRCLTCETVSARDESFLDLSIDIEQNSSVTACLRHFSASEMLCQKNKFFCDSCCDLQEAEKRMKIKKLPNVLALHLKRFKYQEDVGRYIKLNYRVAFPMELRLFNTVDDMENADRLYSLFAIVVHIGTGPHQGHYVSIIKTGGSWFVFDDDAVYPIAESDISKYFGDSNSGSAYVLYYQAVDIDYAELGLRQPEATPVPDASPPHRDVEQIVPCSPINSDVGPPPGLVHESSPDDGPTPESLPPSPPQVLDTPPASLDAAAQLTPTTPTTPHFGTKLLNTLRRAPSSTLAARPNTASSQTAERKRSGMDRSPHPSTSSPSLFDHPVFGDAPPPVPPLPPIIQTPESPPTPLPLPTPLVVLPFEEKPKPSRKDSKSGGWFSKRKSLKLGEKTKSATGDSLPNLPPSPSRREESSSSGWFKSFGSANRESQTTSRASHSTSMTSDYGHSTKDMSIDVDKSRHKNGNARHLTANDGGPGDTPPTPGSISSSLNSSSPAQPTFIATGASSSSSSIPNISTSRSTSSDRTRSNGFDRHVSKDSRNSSPSSNRTRHKPFAGLNLERTLPPLPPTPTFVSHVHSPSNGHVPFVAEPKSYVNGSASDFNEAASSTGPASLNGTHPQSRSTTLPPPSSIAASASANASTGSTPPVTAPPRKATRKLSLTAPMLGFGRKEKKQS
ncbi:cysteine proteinase [Coprinellus micaceus]|uniref:ubiquitinyl hydrolase 1 n=1 Tax=Coprinellus micaceus TaxID=71717 RepID=A0A4Y7TY65_COPMI|nr:cysteine proteinase [Coprinellus micaceus]